MRCVGGLLALVLCVLLAEPPAAHAQDACTNPDALGVSRVIDVDPTGGPLFGEPHGDPNFLKPGEVVLTFDDGPIPGSTRAILAALAAQCTKATFFMVGEMAAAYPEVVREVAAQGHTIGTHTWSHANLRALSEERMKWQIETAFAAVEKAAGQPIAPFFRYPYLAPSRASAAYLRSRNIAQFDVDVDSSDWLLRNARRDIQRVMAGLQRRGRGIILMHDIHMPTALAVPGLLAHLKAKGYKVVQVRPAAPVQLLAAYEAPARGAASRRRYAQVRLRTRTRAAEAKAPALSWLPW